MTKTKDPNFALIFEDFWKQIFQNNQNDVSKSRNISFELRLHSDVSNDIKNIVRKQKLMIFLLFEGNP